MNGTYGVFQRVSIQPAVEYSEFVAREILESHLILILMVCSFSIFKRILCESFFILNLSKVSLKVAFCQINIFCHQLLNPKYDWLIVPIFICLWKYVSLIWMNKNSLFIIIILSDLRRVTKFVLKFKPQVLNFRTIWGSLRKSDKIIHHILG